MKRWRNLLLLFASVLLLSFLVAGCGGGKQETGNQQSSEKIVAKFSHVTAPGTPKGLAAQKFADLVKERTKGRMEIQVFPSSQLYGDKDEFEALQANNVQFIAPSAGKLISFDPRFQIGDMPFLFKDNQGASRFWDSEEGKKLLQSLEKQGMLGLTAWPNGMRQFMNSKKELKTPADFQGLKFRIPAGGVLVDIFQALGAGTSNIPFSEVYTAMQQKVVDGTIATFDNIENEKYAEVLNYLTVANVNNLSYIVVVNKQFWDGLPADLRQTVEQCLKEATDYERQEADKLDQESLAKLKQKIKVYELTPQERQAFVQAMQPVWAKYEPIIGKELFEAAKKVNQ
ncbi:DctP family TRAP transporter solute-binding subunit [Desulfofundulus thermobenzoicus]|uniref:DctP family TRAP transporter solute-binding subunit n=1 Tax=Desulfofundulus thermobenzoicus TaxID=29376 RepID=A0A6N7IQW8_9FIRM|nr:TRAP transporter substrate-binding protein [Desulfofundulus thermobenzoicus]MQL51939.1 DctP family TRAP transporter solute-binding subunit [Desulfofundulus thermobenzoicus]HHW44192.1 TRAP transporter substrate-binding protein [Desulfotomaculum sp.]